MSSLIALGASKSGKLIRWNVSTTSSNNPSRIDSDIRDEILSIIPLDVHTAGATEASFLVQTAQAIHQTSCPEEYDPIRSPRRKLMEVHGGERIVGVHLDRSSSQIYALADTENDRCSTSAMYCISPSESAPCLEPLDANAIKYGSFHPASNQFFAFHKNGNYSFGNCSDMKNFQRGTCGLRDVASVSSAALVTADTAVLSTKNNLLYTYDLRSNKESLFVEQGADLIAVDEAPDSNSFVTSNCRTVHLWDLRTPRFPKSFTTPIHDDRVTSIVCRTDGNMLLTASWDGSLVCWDIRTQKPLHKFSVGSSSEPFVCATLTTNGSAYPSSALLQSCVDEMYRNVGEEFQQPESVRDMDAEMEDVPGSTTGGITHQCGSLNELDKATEVNVNSVFARVSNPGANGIEPIRNVPASALGGCNTRPPVHPTGADQGICRTAHNVSPQNLSRGQKSHEADWKRTRTPDNFTTVIEETRRSMERCTSTGMSDTGRVAANGTTTVPASNPEPYHDPIVTSHPPAAIDPTGHRILQSGTGWGEDGLTRSSEHSSMGEQRTLHRHMSGDATTSPHSEMQRRLSIDREFRSEKTNRNSFPAVGSGSHDPALVNRTVISDQGKYSSADPYTSQDTHVGSREIQRNPGLDHEMGRQISRTSPATAQTAISCQMGSEPLGEDRFLGCLLGLAVGDALGTTVEFMPRGTFPKVTGMTGGGPFRLRPGEWTDDTSMALCLAESLTNCSRFDMRDQLARYVKWMDEGYMSSNGACFDVGNTVRNALFEFKRSNFQRERCGDPPGSSNAGNGSLMRLAPVPMAYAAFPDQAIHYSGISSETTHGSKIAVDSCRFYSGLIVGALHGFHKDDLLSPYYKPNGRWNKADLCKEVRDVAAATYKKKTDRQIKGSGYVVQAMEAALWSFFRTDNFKDGALMVVNLGDDADTTAAIYGQLAGAYYGFQNIGGELHEKLALKGMITDFAKRLHSIATDTHSWVAREVGPPESTREPRYESTREPRYESTREPRYESTREPGYESTREPRYESTREPRYESTREPRYESTREPRYESTREPRYESTREPRYESTHEAGSLR